MKRFRQLQVFGAAALAAGIIAGGCAKKTPVPAPPPPPPVVQEAPPPAPPPAPAPPAVAPEPPRVPTEDEIFASKTLEALNQEQPLAHVAYDYDSYALTDAARAALDGNAAWLRRWSSTRITIEGHADSRGTNEYNLALGDRRAAAARDYLVSLGIAADRLAAISKGEEQPFCSEETESCWAQNRRGYFVITGK
ncbi:MAG TPA: OmpA family protein [Vicinamibacterales bacterium]|nr:OmpA family protein [Vicinamibacterales bacterium]